MPLAPAVEEEVEEEEEEEHESMTTALGTVVIKFGVERAMSEWL